MRPWRSWRARWRRSLAQRHGPGVAAEMTACIVGGALGLGFGLVLKLVSWPVIWLLLGAAVLGLAALVWPGRSDRSRR